MNRYALPFFTILALAALAPATRACDACGIPHVTVLTTGEQGARHTDPLRAIRKRGIEVHVLDGREGGAKQLDLIKKGSLLIVDGNPSGIRTWNQLVRNELQRYLDAGNPVGILWHGREQADADPDPLAQRLRGIFKAGGIGAPAAGRLVGGQDHRNRPHCILNGVDFKGLATRLAAPCKVEGDTCSVLTLGDGNRRTALTWTTSYRGTGERSGNVFVVQADDGPAFGAGAYPQLVANAIFWAMDWDDLIPAGGVRLK